MMPSIAANSYLVFHHWVSPWLLKKGTVVRVNHHRYGKIVKRIKSINAQGDYFLEGMNEHSVSSAQMGAIELWQISGLLLYTIDPTAQSELPSQ